MRTHMKREPIKKHQKKKDLLLMLFLLVAGFSISILFFSGINLYHYLEYHSLEKKLGINKLIFVDDSYNEEILNFLNTVDPKYTQGMEEITVIPSPLFSFSVSAGDEELYRGEATGQYLQEEDSIIFTNNYDFENSFYHELGHRIHLHLFTDSDRKKWEYIMNFSIDQERLKEYKSENNLNQTQSEELDERVKADYNHQIAEAFAIYFAASLTNESKIPHQEIRNYFNELIWKEPTHCYNSDVNLTIQEAEYD